VYIDGNGEGARVVALQGSRSSGVAHSRPS
jgi:hypothetical protein